jgi:uroporphyrin-III C-methyltransferase/precorrin-2 dehydrogenase/sirohydrochlorin ferrochelatase
MTLPITLKLTDRPCLVVGGGYVALQKVRVLAAAGARIRLVAPVVAAELRALAACDIAERPFAPDDLTGVAFVIAATDDPALNDQIYQLAHRRGVLVNVVDDPARCDFLFPSILRRGELSIAVSTDGASPALARLLREALEPEFSPGLGSLLAQVRALRKRARQGLVCPAARRAVNELAARAVVAARGTGNAATLHVLGAWLETLISAEAHHPAAPARLALFNPPSPGVAPVPTVSPGFITLVGAGPGDPELITLAGVRALEAADVVVYDRLVHPALLEHAFRAKHVYLGKIPGENHHRTQTQIHETLLAAARNGQNVVRLKGGDPFIFGRGGEEVQAARAAGVPVRVIPGVTAALGAAATAQIPLTHRAVSGSVTFITACAATPCPGQPIPPGQPDWAQLARLPGTLVIYMGASQASSLAARLLAAGRRAEEPVAIIHQATLPGETLLTTNLQALASLDPAQQPPPPALLIVGDVVGLGLAPALAAAAAQTAG